jgi:toxin ParE1/3/4
MPALHRTGQAEDDLVAIWLHIAADSPAAADRVLDELDHRSQLLAREPRVGPARNDIAPGLRYFPSGRYLILYRLIPNGIEVVRYVHGARDLFALTLPD